MTTFTVPPAGTVPPVPAPDLGEMMIPAVAVSDSVPAPQGPPMAALPAGALHADSNPAPTPVQTPTPARGGGSVAASVRDLASRHGVDLAQVTPTGRGGKITRKDVENAIAATTLTASDPVTPDTAHASVTTLTLKLTLRDGHPVRVATTEDVLALAAAHLPQLRVVGAALELTSEGTVLLAEITTTMEVQL